MPRKYANKDRYEQSDKYDRLKHTHTHTHTHTHIYIYIKTEREETNW